MSEAPAPLPGGGWVSLAHYGTHPVVDTAEQATLRVGLSADRASWALVRHYLARGRLPPPEAVRVEDCLVAMAPVPRSAGGALAIATTLAPSPFRAGWRTLVIAITAPVRATPRSLVVVSATPDGPLERALAERGAAVQPGEGLAFADHLGTGDLVFVGDGGGLGGPDAQRALLDRVAAHAELGRTVSVVARLEPGMDDALLDRIAMAGGGTHDVLVPGEERSLAERLVRPVGLARAIASLRFDPGRVRRWRLVGHESRVAGPVARPEGGLVPSGDGVYLLFEVELTPGDGALGTVRVSAFDTAREAALEDGTPDAPHRAVVAIAAFAEKLRGSFWARNIAWEEIAREVDGLDSPALRAELGALVAQSQALWAEGPGLERALGATRWLP